ncbi:MAG: substrate-binding periplasmic protein [Clostridiaceae bacterium]
MDRLITVGADPFPPYQYYDDDGELKGSDYETVKESFKKAGYEIKVILGEWAGVESLLAEGKIDAAFQVQKNPEREKKYYFSELLRSATTEIVTGCKTLKLESLSKIEEKKLSVGVIANYSYGKDIDSLDNSLKRSFNSQEELLRAIDERKVDIGVFDKGVKEYIAEREGLKNIYSIKNLEFNRPLYVVFNDEKLRDEFNAGRKSGGELY